MSFSVFKTKQISFSALLLLVFLLPLAVSWSSFVSSQAVKLALFWVLSYIFLFSAVVYFVGRESVSFARSRLLLLAVLILSAYAFSQGGKVVAIGAHNPAGAFSFVLPVVFLFLIIPSLVKTKEKIFYILLVFLFSSGLVLALNLFHLFGISPGFLSYSASSGSPLFLKSWLDVGVFAGLLASWSILFLSNFAFTRILKIFVSILWAVSLIVLIILNLNFALIFPAVVSLAMVLGLFSGFNKTKGFYKKLRKQKLTFCFSLITLVSAFVFVFAEIPRQILVDYFSAFSSPEIEALSSWGQFTETAKSGYFAGAGVFGAVAWFLFIIGFIDSAVKFFLKKKANNPFLSKSALIYFSGALYIWLISVFYKPDLTLIVFGFVFTSLYLVSSSLSISKNKAFRTIKWQKRPIFGLALTAFLFMSLALGAVGLFFAGSGYLAAFDYFKAKRAYAEEDYDKAKELINSSIEKKDYDDPRRLAARIYLKELKKIGTIKNENQKKDFQKDWQKAIENAEASTELDRNDYRNWQVLGDLYALASSLGVNGAGEEAKQAYSRAQDLVGFNLELSLSRAKLESQSDNYSEASSVLDETLAAYPKNTEALFLAAENEMKKGNLEKAAKYIEKIIEKEPKNVSARFKLSVIRMHQKKYNSAIRQFKETLDLYPDHITARYLLGLTYSLKSDNKKAIEQIEKVKSMEPGNSQIDKILKNLKQNKPPLSGLKKQNQSFIKGGQIEGY